MVKTHTWNQTRFADCQYIGPVAGFASGETAMLFNWSGDPSGAARDFRLFNRLVGSLSIHFRPDLAITDPAPVDCLFGTVTWGIIRTSERAGNVVQDHCSQILASAGADDDSDEPWLWREAYQVWYTQTENITQPQDLLMPLRGDAAGQYVAMPAETYRPGWALNTKFDIPFRQGRGTNLDRSTILGFRIDFRSWADTAFNDTVGIHPQWSGDSWLMYVSLFAWGLLTRAE